MTKWTTKQEEIVLMYANLGAEFIATEIEEETGVRRSVSSIVSKAHQMGVSMVKYQVCPRCGAKVRKLNRNTGLCRDCNMKELRDNALREQAFLIRELNRNEETTAEYERIRREYLAVSRANQRLAKKLGLPPKRSRGTFWEREVLQSNLQTAWSGA